MIVIKDELETGTAWFDVDDTLVIWEYTDSMETVTCNNYGKDVTLGIHKPHLEQLKKFKERGWVIVVWSQGGAEWAEEVVTKLGIENWVDLVITKPRYIFDDLETRYWMPHRRYIHYEKKTP